MFPLSQRFKAEAVIHLPRVRTREELLPALVRATCEAHGLPDPEAILAAVREREAKLPTSVGLGIAVPHARVEGLGDLHAGAAICPAGLDFPVPDGLPVRLVVLLVSPPSAAGLHVKALAAVGRVSSERVEDLVRTADAREFLERWAVGEARASGTA